MLGFKRFLSPIRVYKDNLKHAQDEPRRVGGLRAASVPIHPYTVLNIPVYSHAHTHTYIYIYIYIHIYIYTYYACVNV